MGEVFKAWDPSLGRFVALKYLRRDDPSFTERLLREARLQARVDHELVCKVYEVGEDAGRPFIAMQYVDGRNLEEEAPHLSIAEALALVADVAGAVHAAHETGLIHRDLKPHNVLVERTPTGVRPRVVDFGLAREPGEKGLTETGALVGTPAYMAPEQAAGNVRALDRRTDVYGLGAVLYRLLAGRPPFEGTDIEVAIQAAHADPPPLRRLAPSVPEDVQTIVMRCLEKSPDRRYPTAQALAADLRRFLAREPIEARPASWSHRFRRRVERNRTLSMVAAAALLAVALLGAVALKARRDAAVRLDAALRFGQEAERIEVVLTHAYLLPRHDLRPEKSMVRERLAWISAEMARLGGTTEGPGRFALGRGHLALFEHDAARIELERAWAAGYRTPEVSQALGRALGELYVKAREALPGLPKAEREVRRQEIEETLKKPALIHLAARRPGAADERAYFDALIADYDGRFEDALAHAQRAAALSPALYDARRLSGDVYMRRGRTHWAAGEYDAAHAAYAQAGAEYAQALAIGRSDPRAHRADCARLKRVFELRLMTGDAGAADYDAAREACSHAVQVDDEQAFAYRIRSEIHWRWAERLFTRGEAALAIHESAVADASAAVKRDPRDDLAYVNLATAYWGIAEEQRQRGEDAAGALASAVDAYDQANAVRGTYSSYNNLAGALDTLALVEMERGRDPAATLKRGIAAAEAAIKLGPKVAAPYSTLGSLYITMARDRIERGEDASAALDQARDSCRRALEINAQNIHSLDCSGETELLAARDRAARSEDPQPALALSEDYARRQEAVNAELPNAALRLGEASLVRGEWHLAQGRDPAAAAAAALGHFARAARLHPQNPVVALGRARAALLMAMHATRHGRPATAALERAAGDLARAVEWHAAPAEVEGVRAEILLARARTLSGPAAGTVAAGARAAVRKSLEANPRRVRPRRTLTALERDFPEQARPESASMR